MHLTGTGNRVDTSSGLVLGRAGTVASASRYAPHLNHPFLIDYVTFSGPIFSPSPRHQDKNSIRLQNVPPNLHTGKRVFLSGACCGYKTTHNLKFKKFFLSFTLWEVRNPKWVIWALTWVIAKLISFWRFRGIWTWCLFQLLETFHALGLVPSSIMKAYLSASVSPGTLPFLILILRPPSKEASRDCIRAI